jgi:hypothetical protein
MSNVFKISVRVSSFVVFILPLFVGILVVQI